MEIDLTIKYKIDTITKNVQEFLLPVDQISEEGARKILGKYTAAIEGNFVNWMAAAAVSSRSVQSRFAAEENIYVEMKDDHPGMLRSFVRSAGAEPTIDNYQAIYGAVNSIRRLVSQMSGAENIALMAILENSSAVFIPFLADLVKKLGSTNLFYTDVHGVADIKHADQFVWALTYEKEHYPDFDLRIDKTGKTVLELLKEIFTK